MLAEAFILPQNRIIQQDAHALYKTSKQNLVKHLQQCTKAFQKSSALSILQEDRIRFLTTINNKAKVRRSTKSLILGKTKVMSYEDLVEARAKQVIKDLLIIPWSDIYSERNVPAPWAQCLQDLRTTDPHDDKRRIKETKGGLLRGSYCWILGNSDFQQWHKGKESQLLWIQGNPGKGKTMLSAV